MSRTQTESRTRTQSNDRSRGRRTFEVWLINEPKRQQPDKEGDRIARDGRGRNPKVTTLSDLPHSRAAERDRESYDQDNETPAQTDKSWRNATDRYHTSSTNSRPLGNDNPSAGIAYLGSHRRRSSTDNTERRYATQDPIPPHDSRHTFSSHILPDQHIPSDVEKILSDCTREKRSIAELLSQTREKLKVANTRNEELETQVKSLTEELEAMKDQLREAESRRRRTARLLKETASELHGAKQFLTKTEAMSEMDIVNMVDNLNAEIMQTSALIADALGELNRRKEPESTVNVDERGFNRRAVGNALIRYLECEGPSINPMSVQLALQFCLAETCYVVIESWRPGKWKGEDLLFDIYSSMKRTEIQSVVGRWRALTRAQTNYQENQAKVNAYFYRRVRDVLSLAGWPSNIQECRDFLERFKERTEHLADLSLHLHRAVSQDMTSGELRMKMVYPEEKFNHESIDQAFPNEMSSLDNVQLESASGTTDLGLVRTVGTESRTLKKPRIVLESALHALLDGS